MAYGSSSTFPRMMWPGLTRPWSLHNKLQVKSCFCKIPAISRVYDLPIRWRCPPKVWSTQRFRVVNSNQFSLHKATQSYPAVIDIVYLCNWTTGLSGSSPGRGAGRSVLDWTANPLSGMKLWRRYKDTSQPKFPNEKSMHIYPRCNFYFSLWRCT